MTVHKGNEKALACIRANDYEGFLRQVNSEEGIDCDGACGDPNAGTLLHAAARQAAVAITRRLLHLGANVRFKDSRWKTAHDYGLERVKSMEKELGLNFYGSQGYPPDVNDEQWDQWCDARENLRMIRDEMQSVAVYDSPPGLALMDRLGQTGVHMAAFKGELENVREWIEDRGELQFDPPARDPIEDAIRGEHADVMRLFLQAQPTRYGVRMSEDGTDGANLVRRIVERASMEMLNTFFEERPSAGLARVAVNSAEGCMLVAKNSMLDKYQGMLDRSREILEDLEDEEAAPSVSMVA